MLRLSQAAPVAVSSLSIADQFAVSESSPVVTSMLNPCTSPVHLPVV